MRTGAAFGSEPCDQFGPLRSKVPHDGERGIALDLRVGLSFSSVSKDSALTTLALPHIAKLHAYTPGLQPTEPGWIKLNTNECPYPPSPKVAAAIRHEVGEDGRALRLYPNPKSTPLRAAIAQHHAVREENVIIGNGSDDILNLLMRAFVTSNAAAGYTLPSYSLYPVLVEIQDGATNVVEFDRSLRLPIDRI